MPGKNPAQPEGNEEQPFAKELKAKKPQTSAELGRFGRIIAKIRRSIGVGLLAAMGGAGAYEGVHSYLDMSSLAPTEKSNGFVDRLKEYGKKELRNSDIVKSVHEKIRNVASWAAAINAFALLSILLNSGANLLLGDPVENAKNRKIRSREKDEKEFYNLIIAAIGELEKKISMIPSGPTDNEKSELNQEIEQLKAELAKISGDGNKRIGIILRALKRIENQVGISEQKSPEDLSSTTKNIADIAVPSSAGASLTDAEIEALAEEEARATAEAEKTTRHRS